MMTQPDHERVKRNWIFSQDNKMAALARQRDIIRAVFRLPEKVNSKQKLDILKSAEEFAALLGSKRATDADLAPGGLVWPAGRSARRAAFLAAVHQIQAGPAVLAPISPAAAKRLSIQIKAPVSHAVAKRLSNQMAAQAAAAAAERRDSKHRDLKMDPEMVVTMNNINDNEHVGDIEPGATFDLSKQILSEMKKYVKNKKSDSLVDIALAMIAHLYEEREEQNVDVARTIDVSALSNDPDPETKQAEVIASFPADVLNRLVLAVNSEIRIFNRFEQTFPALAKEARKRALTETSKGQKARGDVVKAEAKLAEMESKGVSESKLKTQRTAIKRAKEVLDEILQGAETEAINRATRDADTAKEKRLSHALVGQAEYERNLKKQRKKTAYEMAELGDEDFFNARLRQMKLTYKDRTSKELREILKDPKRSADLEEEEALKSTLRPAIKRGRNDLDEKAREKLIDSYLTTRRAMLDAEPGSNEEKKLENQVKAFEVEFGLTKKRNAMATATAAAEEEEEEEEDDEEFKPEEESDEEAGTDDEEEEEGDEKAGGAGGANHNPRRVKTPKTYSGAGAFAINHPQPFKRRPGFYASHLPQLPTYPYRVGGYGALPPVGWRAPPRYFSQRPGVPMFRRPRIGGGCGCDPLNAPNDEDSPQ